MLQHCEEHSGCVESINNLRAGQTAIAARFDAHCANGGKGHVQRYEFTTVTEDVRTLTTDVRQLHDELQTAATDRKVDAARQAKRDRIWQSVVPSIALIVSAIIALYK